MNKKLQITLLLQGLKHINKLIMMRICNFQLCLKVAASVVHYSKKREASKCIEA